MLNGVQFNAPFCWYQHFFKENIKNDVMWCHTVGFSSNFLKMFLLSRWYICPKMKSIASSKPKLWAITFFGLYKENIRKYLPTPNKTLITFLVLVVWTWNFQEIFKTKFCLHIKKWGAFGAQFLKIFGSFHRWG